MAWTLAVAVSVGWGWREALAQWRIRSIIPGASAEVAEAGTGLPLSKSLLLGTDGYFSLEIDLFLNTTSAASFLEFQWAQNTSNAGNTFVFATSFIEITEMR